LETCINILSKYGELLLVLHDHYYGFEECCALFTMISSYKY
jgi:hypothetical protein